MPDFNAQADWEYGGGGPSSHKSADGTRFWAALEKIGSSTGPLRLVVYRTDANGQTVLNRWADSGILGQGAGLVLQADGSLEAQGFTGVGDNQTMRAVSVPGWVAWPAATGVPGPQGPLGPQGPQGIPGPAGGGALEAEQVKALDWLIGKLRWLGVLL